MAKWVQMVLLMIALTLNAEDMGGMSSTSIVSAIKANPTLLDSPQAQQAMKQRGVTEAQVLQKVNQSSGVATTPSTTESTEQKPINQIDKTDSDEKKDSVQNEMKIKPSYDIRSIYRSPLTMENDSEYAKRLLSRQIKGQSSSLSRYGFEFFSNKNGMDLASLPVPENYKLVPKDVVSVVLYGPRTDNMSLGIDKEGNILIPSFGPLHIAGLTFGEARKTISDALMAAYPNVGVTVNITQFSSIQVTLAGEVATPGLYNISSFSTVKEALIAAGGLSKNGSMRSVLIKRGGRLYKTIDLYSIIRGNGHNETLLQAGDIIVVPVMGKSVTIDGDVKRPAIYEAKENTTIGELIAFAGGISAEASQNDIRITRYETHEQIRVLKVTLTEAKKMVVMDQDKIYVHDLDKSNLRGITLYGNVVKPGFWPLNKEGMELRELFKREISQNTLRGVFLENTHFDYALIKRVRPNLKEEVIGFSLTKALNGEESVKLYSRDEIYILNRSTVTPPSIVKISGECIARPGEYKFFDKMTFEGLLSTAGTICPIDRAKVTIVSPDIEAMSMKVRVVDTMKDSPLYLKEFDDIRTIGYFTTNPIKNATINGEVFKPGVYPVPDTGMPLKQLIESAGGITEKASLDKFEIIRYGIKNGIRVQHVEVVSANRALTDENLMINNYDEVTVYRIPKWTEKKMVKILGKVKYPGEYTLDEGETLLDLIKRAGGFTETAYLEGAVFTREELKVRQRDAVEHQIKELEQRIMFQAVQPAQAGQTVNDKSFMITMLDGLKNEVKQTEFVGRLAINMNKIMKNDQNILLKNGDALYIPEREDSVLVQGQVLNPNAFMFVDGLSIEDYVEKAGGYKPTADTRNVFIVHANGEAEPIQHNYLFGSSTHLGYGDSIIVPMELQTISGIQYAKDITSILYQLAVSVAALNTIGAL